MEHILRSTAFWEISSNYKGDKMPPKKTDATEAAGKKYVFDLCQIFYSEKMYFAWWYSIYKESFVKASFILDFNSFEIFVDECLRLASLFSTKMEKLRDKEVCFVSKLF